MFRAEAKINRRLSLREIQDVLNFIHAYAWRLPLSLRMVREIAVERMISPDDWDTKLIAGLPPEPRLKIAPPPAPKMFGHAERHGLPRQPTGFERREAKRLAKQIAQQTTVTSDLAPETALEEVKASDVDKPEPQPDSLPKGRLEADALPPAGAHSPFPTLVIQRVCW